MHYSRRSRLYLRDHGLCERHVRRHDVRVRRRAAAVQGDRRVPAPEIRGPAVRVRQDHRRRSADRTAERAQTLVPALLRDVRRAGVAGRAGDGRRVPARPAVAGRRVEPPLAVGPDPAPRAVVQRGRRGRGRHDGRAPVLAARVRDALRQ